MVPTKCTQHGGDETDGSTDDDKFLLSFPIIKLVVVNKTHKVRAAYHCESWFHLSIYFHTPQHDALGGKGPHVFVINFVIAVASSSSSSSQWCYGGDGHCNRSNCCRLVAVRAVSDYRPFIWIGLAFFYSPSSPSSFYWHSSLANVETNPIGRVRVSIIESLETWITK